jgi:predicted nucleic acid-binding protein
MVYKVFLDTNIIIDFFQKSRDLHHEAKQIFFDIADGKISGYFSESVINTTAYILRNDLSKDDLIYQLDVLNSQLLFCLVQTLLFIMHIKEQKMIWRAQFFIS